MYDGSGGAPYVADVGIAGDRVAAIGALTDARPNDYLYDGQAGLVKRRQTTPSHPGAADEKTTYAGGIYEEINTACEAPHLVTKHYNAFGRVIAQRRNGVISYLLADHLSSTVGTVSASTGSVTQMKYWPFGAPRTNHSPFGREFTGQQREGTFTVGAYYYKARFYSTVLGRFMSADPIVPEANSRGLNRYSYVYNNPIRFDDPSGHCPPCPEPAPVAGDQDAQDRVRCKSSFSACAAFAFALAYGSLKTGIVIVMGLFQAKNDAPGEFWGFVEDFLSRTNNCGYRVAQCVAGFSELLAVGGTDAAYDIFGIKIIESDPGGWGGGAIMTDRGYGALDRILTDARGKNLIGVMGYSLGAGTVARYYADHLNAVTSFFLNEGSRADVTFVANVDDARGHASYAGEIEWNAQHIPHNQWAGVIIDALTVHGNERE